MNQCAKRIIFLVADDDEKDRILISEVIEEECPCYDLHMVEDGQALLDYLYRRGKYEDEALSPFPDLILLDLNMPGMSGFDALRDIKSDPKFRLIPIIIFSITREDEAIARSYDTGASTFITKPMSYAGLVRVMKKISEFWCEVATLPPKKCGC